jgi:hypothetical protein
VTSVDTIYLLESLVAVRFTVEEKNRIRRNLGNSLELAQDGATSLRTGELHQAALGRAFFLRPATILGEFKAVTPEDRAPSSICISCILWEEKNECYATSLVSCCRDHR